MTTFTISEADYLAAQRLFLRPTPLKRWLRVGGAAALVAIALSLDGSDAWAVWGGLGGLVVASAAMRWLVTPVLARRNYRQHKGIHAEMDLALEPDGLRYTTADANVLLRWDKILKWREDDGYILVYHSPRLFNIVPKSLAPSGLDLGALTASLEERVGPAS